MNEAHLLGLVHGSRHVIRTARVEADAFVVPAWHHRDIGQPQHAEEHARGLRTHRRLGASAATGPTASGRRAAESRLRDFHVHIRRKRPRAVDPAARTIDSFDRREFRNVGEEEITDIDHRRTVRSERGNGERRQHRTLPESGHLSPDRRRAVGDEVVLLGAQHDTRSFALPLHDRARATAEEASRILQCRFDRAADEQHLAPEFGPRDLEVEALADAMHVEQAALRYRTTGDDLRIRPRPGCCATRASRRRRARGGACSRRCSTSLTARRVGGGCRGRRSSRCRRRRRGAAGAGREANGETRHDQREGTSGHRRRAQGREAIHTGASLRYDATNG